MIGGCPLVCRRLGKPVLWLAGGERPLKFTVSHSSRPPTTRVKLGGERLSLFGNVVVFLSLFVQRGLILVFERPLCGF